MLTTLLMETARPTVSIQGACLADSIFVGMTKLFPHDPDYLTTADLKRWALCGYEVARCKGTLQN